MTKYIKTKNNIQKRAMIEALEKSLGVVTTACKIVGIDRTLHYKWMKEDQEYADEVLSLSEMVLDFAESKLHNLISTGDTTATIFFLKTKGKKRGYIERQEITGADGDKLNAITVEIINGATT